MSLTSKLKSELRDEGFLVIGVGAKGVRLARKNCVGWADVKYEELNTITVEEVFERVRAEAGFDEVIKNA